MFVFDPSDFCSEQCDATALFSGSDRGSKHFPVTPLIPSFFTRLLKV